MKIESGYRVIEIISDEELLINYGMKDGADIGKRIIIYSIGEPILSPDTGEEIGTLDVIKDELEIAYCVEHFSVCKKYSYTSSFLDTMAAMVNPYAIYSKKNRITEKLDVDAAQISGRKWSKGGTIYKNDYAMVISEK